MQKQLATLCKKLLPKRAERLKFGNTKSNYGFLIAVFCGKLIAEIYGKVLAVYSAHAGRTEIYHLPPEGTTELILDLS